MKTAEYAKKCLQCWHAIMMSLLPSERERERERGRERERERERRNDIICHTDIQYIHLIPVSANRTSVSAWFWKWKQVSDLVVHRGQIPYPNSNVRKHGQIGLPRKSAESGRRTFETDDAHYQISYILRSSPKRITLSTYLSTPDKKDRRFSHAAVPLPYTLVYQLSSQVPHLYI